jgi:hypothetical protein
MIRSMGRLAPKITLAWVAFVLTLGTAPAFADRCESACGPAPCCMILWVPLCGCPWGEPGDVEIAWVAPPSDAELAGAMCALPSGTSASEFSSLTGTNALAVSMPAH